MIFRRVVSTRKQGAHSYIRQIPGNVCFEYEYGNEAAVKEAFGRAAHVTRVSLESQRIVGNPMEPKACLAAYDAASGVFDVYTATQGMSMMRAGLSAVTSVAPEKIRVHARDVGGGFGIRSDAYAEFCVLMLAAQKLGRPVKWVASRSETSLSDYHGRAATLKGELALDRDGKFLGIKIEWLCDMGAYLSHPGALINTLPPSLHAVEPLPHPGGARPAPAGPHQHRADHRLPRRRAPQRLLPRRAPGGGGGARDRHRPHRAAPAQPDSERGVPVQDADRRSRPTTAATHRVCWTRFWNCPGGTLFGKRSEESEQAGQAARHRLLDVRRAGRRGRRPEGGGRHPLRRVGRGQHPRALRPVGAGPRDRVPGGHGADHRRRSRAHHAAGGRSGRAAAGGRGHHRLALDDGARRRHRGGGARDRAQGARSGGEGSRSLPRGPRVLRRHLPRQGNRRLGHA